MRKWRIAVLTFTLALVTLVAGCDVVGDGSGNIGNNEVPGSTDTSTNTSGFRITYHSNGATSGDAPVDSSNYAAGDNALILPGGNLARFVNVGGENRPRHFVGWNTQPDGSGTTYHPHRSVTIHGNLNLYPRWAPDEFVYTLEFWFGVPAVTDGNRYLAGDQVTLPGQDYTGWSGTVNFIEGRELTHWTSFDNDINTGYDYDPGYLITISNHRRFDPRFSNRLYTITFVEIGENVVWPDDVPWSSEGLTIEVAFETLMTEAQLGPIDGLSGDNFLQFTDDLPKPTREGFRLVDWVRARVEYDEEFGQSTEWDSAWTSNGRMPAQDLELRPVWQALPAQKQML